MITLRKQKPFMWSCYVLQQKLKNPFFFSKIVDLSWSTNNPLPLFGIWMNGHIDCKEIMMHVIRFAK